MALDPLEWIIIGVVVIVIFLWGPSKIPELARSIGRARKEFDTAKKEFENPTETLLNAATQAPPQRPVQPSADDVLIQTARKLGIVTEGKTREQIANEIVARSAPANPGTTTA